MNNLKSKQLFAVNRARTLLTHDLAHPVTPSRMRVWLLGLCCWLGGTHGAVVQRVTGPGESEITHASAGGGVTVYLTGSNLGTPFNPREWPH